MPSWNVYPAAPDLRASYDRVLLTKVGLFVVMIGIAAVNRSALLTRLRVAAGLVARQLSATIAIEQVLAVAVLFAVSLLACIDPAE